MVKGLSEWRCSTNVTGPKHMDSKKCPRATIHEVNVAEIELSHKLNRTEK